MRKFRLYLNLSGGNYMPRSSDFPLDYTLEEMKKDVLPKSMGSFLPYQYREVLPGGTEKVVKFKKVKKEINL